MELIIDILPWGVAILGVLWAIIKTFGGREVARYDDLVGRVVLMEKTYVNKEELNKILDRLREERKEIAGANKEHLDKIDKNIDETRHVINGALNTLTVKVAVIEKVLELQDIESHVNQTGA